MHVFSHSASSQIAFGLALNDPGADFRHTTPQNAKRTLIPGHQHKELTREKGRVPLARRWLALARVGLHWRAL
eukprot:6722063-Alexandrium_andersonii.AAC.1